ncbi:50S ribosomal protein L30 [Candidatus Oleimmundimicrobium sp.]|uniref:50S ribosomal protein L30 n=1 Tax=Candidatus Oleimmundimicrobium sp. TaxID=3060597 RepID=UPI00271E5608|nr:50S ribosomal protein L30 [Candidatus Oleimmundimicrobium sp.]MDO8886045.1 50S ribosomal protein L30 [Candidatus Oleimmundimicrobium sp.]
MTKLKIKQVASIIGHIKSQRQTVRALGLKRINDVVIKNNTPEIRGMINKVSHLLKVEEIS